MSQVALPGTRFPRGRGALHTDRPQFPDSAASEKLHVSMLIARSDTVGGGANVHVLDLCAALRARGARVTVIVGGDGPYVDELQRRGIPHVAIPALGREVSLRNDPRALLEIVGALRRLRPSVLAAHSAKAGFLGRLAGRLLGIPVLYTPHCWAFAQVDSSEPNTRYLLIEQLVGRLPGTIINVSCAERDFALRHRVGRTDRHLVIYNGVVGTEDRRAQPQLSPPRLVMVARCEEPKDHETTLRALQQVADLPWEAEFVGGGPLQALHQRSAVSKGLAGRVAFVGPRDDVPERLARAQVFMLMSKWESLPLSVLEAMRAGLPAVAADVGGMREAIVHGHTGFIVPSGDPAALARRLRMLLGDPFLRSRMGQEGRVRFEQRFTFERMFAETEAAYRSAIAHHSFSGRL